jgi:hypothetical protein
LPQRGNILDFEEEIKTRNELEDWLSKTEMREDSTEFRAFSPAAESVEDGQILPEANLEIWRLVKNTHLAGQYRKYERLLLSFVSVNGWCQFQEAYASGRVETGLFIGESEETALALSYFDEVAKQHGVLNFKFLKATRLPPVECMNQPHLGRDVFVILHSDRLLSAIEISSLFVTGGHDLVWRILGDGEESADRVEMNSGHFLQFRNLLQSDQYGMMADCKQGEAGVVLHFLIWSQENIGAFRQAIADILVKLDVKEVRCGNCVLTSEQYIRVIKEGARCLSEIFPANETR